MINVVCIKHGAEYGAEYVNNLYLGVKRNTTGNFKFWCFTNNSDGIDKNISVLPLPFENAFDYNWNKLYLFNLEIPIPWGETIFFIDLNTLVVGNLNNFFDKKYTKLTLLKDFLHNTAKSNGLVNTSIMAWPHGKYHYLWRDFLADQEKIIKAAESQKDHWWVRRSVPDFDMWQDHFPEQILSFKLHCRHGLSAKAKFVRYYGSPSIPESATQINKVDRLSILPQPWVAKHWNMPSSAVPDIATECTVRYVEIPARKIFGMVGRCGGGHNTLWEDWSADGRRKRNLIMHEYEKNLDEICGHYSKLEKSILEDGFRNPVIITSGLPRRRHKRYLPPELLNGAESDLLLLEGTTGGSRLHVAQKYDLTIPCLVNDWTGKFKNYPKISTEAQARNYYNDQPNLIKFEKSGAIVESFDDKKVGHHLGQEWREDRLMPLRAPMWISIMNRYGYEVNRLSSKVTRIIEEAQSVSQTKAVTTVNNTKNLVNIVCVKWGTKYGPDYVNKLYASIKRNTTVPFKFHCYTESAEKLNNEIVIHKLPYIDLEGWWNKMYLFSNDNELTPGEHIFYVDLDTVIVGNIDHILKNLPKQIVVLRDFYYNIAKTAGEIGSGLMSWRHGQYNFIWDQFVQNPEAAIASVRPHGDQHYIAKCIDSYSFWQDLYPDQIVSFKVHCRDGLPGAAKIICYHGRPDIPDSASKTNTSYKWTIAPQPWVLDHWRE